MAANMATIDKENNSSTLIYCSSTTHEGTLLAGWKKVVQSEGSRKETFGGHDLCNGVALCAEQYGTDDHTA